MYSGFGPEITMGKTRRGNMHEDTQAKAGWTAQPSALHALKRGEGLAVRRSQMSAPAPHLAVPSATLRPHSPPQSSPQGPSPLLPSCIRTWEDGSPPLEFPSPSFIYFTKLKHFFYREIENLQKRCKNSTMNSSISFLHVRWYHFLYLFCRSLSLSSIYL